MKITSRKPPDNFTVLLQWLVAIGVPPEELLNGIGVGIDLTTGIVKVGIQTPVGTHVMHTFHI